MEIEGPERTLRERPRLALVVAADSRHCVSESARVRRLQYELGHARREGVRVRQPPRRMTIKN